MSEPVELPLALVPEEAAEPEVLPSATALEPQESLLVAAPQGTAAPGELLPVQPLEEPASEALRAVALR